MYRCTMYHVSEADRKVMIMDDVIDELVPVDPEDFLPCPGERRDKYAHGMEEVDVPCTDVPCKQSRKEANND